MVNRDGLATKENQYNNPYTHTYAYEHPDLPNAVTSITNGILGGIIQTFDYDSNGNMTNHMNGMTDRSLTWDEDNRLKAINISEANMQHYIYDYAGERVMKGKGNYFAAGQMGAMSAEGWNLGDYTLYVNPYLVIDGNGQASKHYFSGSERITSRLDGYVDDFFTLSVETDALLNTLVDRQVGDITEVSSQDTLQNLTILAETYNSSSVTSGSYFYHSDHLGSASFLTDGAGQAYQFIAYLPFGEAMAEQRSSSNAGNYNTPYRYTGQELDAETGLYYYGARYYDPRVSLFMSVDPLADKYPHLMAFAYVGNNPVNAIDPDGRKIIFINGKLGGGSPDGGKAYWNSRFVEGAKDYFYDDKTYFVDTDYGYFSTPKGRTNQGYKWAKKNYEILVEGMEKGEVFNLVSHSMGGAFSKGIEKYLEEKEWEVQANVMINTYQVDRIKVESDDTTDNIDYQNTDDPVLFWLDINKGKGQLRNANSTIREDSGEENFNYIHRAPIDGGRIFWDDLYEKIIESINGKID